MRGRDRSLAAPLASVAIGLWGLVFIARTSFVVGGRRYFGVLDDAVISMAYARNLVEGRGLLWNAGTPAVEGFSHPLWLAPMIAAQVSGLPVGVRPVILQLVSLLLLMVLPFVVARLASRLCDGGDSTGLAVALAAACYPLAVWSLLGMETALQALLLVVACERALAALEEKRSPDRLFFVCLALGFWLRMDFVVAGGALLGGLVLLRPAVLRAPGFRGGAAAFGVAVLALFGARWLIFHELLPNTYYLKLAGVPLGVRLARGAVTFAEFVGETALYWGVLAVLGLRLVSRPQVRLLAGVIGAQCAYSIWVGGDVWDRWDTVGANRFLAPVLPVVTVIAAAAVTRRLPPASSQKGRRPSLLAVGVVLAVAANGFIGGRRATTRLATLVGLEPPMQAGYNRMVVERLEAFDRLSEPGGRCATVWSGWPAYLRPERRWYDLLGYNDRAGARAAPAVRLTVERFDLFTPGHVKWDYERALREGGVTAFFQVWPRPIEASCAGSLAALPRERERLRRAGFRCRDGFWLRSSPY